MTTASRRFVGFGFGPIQSALFLFEAYRSGNFSSFTVAEVDPNLVQAVRDAGGSYTINIAHPDHIEQATVEGVTLLNPADDADRASLIDAIARADELATALPSVQFYDRGKPSVVDLLAQGMQARLGQDPQKPAILYAAENHNHAAEILEKHLLQALAEGPATQPNLYCLNTVIGKMSGVIDDPQVIASMDLTPLCPGANKAVLVEAFNRILISRAPASIIAPGIEVFQQKDDLLPFEQAKLFGHNAIHAWLGYLAHERGLTTMSQLTGHQDLLDEARKAFIDESGKALIRANASVNDELFTEAGFKGYADDLLERMVNANLRDLVERVVRDPKRKVGYHDRLFGAMRLCLAHDVKPKRLSRGAAAAVRYLIESTETNDLPEGSPGSPDELTHASLTALLQGLWQGQVDEHADAMIAWCWHALEPS